MSGLRITDGTTTVFLHDPTSGVYGQVKYKPETPEIASIEATDALLDGGELPINTYRNVTESAEVVVQGSESSVRDVLASINRLFDKARMYQRRRFGARVYVEFRPNDTDSWYRSEILNGRSLMDDDVLHVALRAGLLMFTVTWTRRYYWEGVESYLSLSNGHGSGTSGVTVYASNDSTRDNYVTLGSVSGDLPAPCRLEMRNTYNDANDMHIVYVGHHATAALSDGDWTYEAESMSVTQASSTLNNSGYSNGSSLQWSLSNTTEYILGHWTLSTAKLQRLAGAYYRAVLVTPNVTGTVAVRLTLKVDAVSPVWTGPWVRLETAQIITELHDLYAVPLPPWSVASGDSPYPLTLHLEARGEVAGAHTLQVDCLHLLPTESFRKFQAKGWNCPYLWTLVDDEMNDTVYTDNTTSRLGNYIAYGSKVMLVPNVTNRLIFTMNAENEDFLAARTISVRVAYRPRRITL